jgi:NagD protein
MMRTARSELGLDASRTTMIGDTMETDILGGVQLGYRTILVLSGGTQRGDLAGFAYRPDMIVDSIADLSVAELAGIPARGVA